VESVRLACLFGSLIMHVSGKDTRFYTSSTGSLGCFNLKLIADEVVEATPRTTGPTTTPKNLLQKLVIKLDDASDHIFSPATLLTLPKPATALQAL